MVRDDVLTKEFCESVIKKYEEDDRKIIGKTQGGIDINVKNSQDLYISRLCEWNDICSQLDSILKTYTEKYLRFIKDTIGAEAYSHGFEDVLFGGYQIQKSGHYKWHNDDAVEMGKHRYITFIFYLNTITDGGETDFKFKQVKPVEGRLVMFPASWNYIHCGRPTNNKYIITGWIYKELTYKKMLT